MKVAICDRILPLARHTRHAHTATEWAALFGLIPSSVSRAMGHLIDAGIMRHGPMQGKRRTYRYNGVP